MDRKLTDVETYWLLEDLCARLGFCLPPSQNLYLQQSGPSDPDAFTDAVFRAEGLDPKADKRLDAQVQAMVGAAFRRANERGA